MRTFFLVIAILVIATLAYARQATLTWEYNTDNVPDLAGFNLYMDGQSVCNFPDPVLRTAQCDITVDEGPHAYTMTAYDGTGQESPHSTEIIFDLPPGNTVFNVIINYIDP